MNAIHKNIGSPRPSYWYHASMRKNTSARTNRAPVSKLGICRNISRGLYGQHPYGPMRQPMSDAPLPPLDSQPPVAPLRPLPYEPASAFASQRIQRWIITAGILVSSVALIRIAMESLAAFGVIFIPSWLAGMCDRYVWSIPACLVLIFTWAFNLFLLFGSILHLQNRPS